MFKLNPSKTFKYPVKFTSIDENGRQQTHEITAIFRRLPNSVFQRLIADNQAKQAERRQASEAGVMTDPDAVMAEEVDLLMQFVEDWEGVYDADGQPLAFTAEHARQLLDAVPNLGHELMLSFVTAHTGGQKRKN